MLLNSALVLGLAVGADRVPMEVTPSVLDGILTPAPLESGEGALLGEGSPRTLEETLVFEDIPEIRSSDSPAWLYPKELSAAASVLMLAAAGHALPPWPTWIENPLEPDLSREELTALASREDVVFDPDAWRLGHQTDWGAYLGGRFQLPGLGAFEEVQNDAAMAPMSGIGGLVGLDPEASAQVALTLARLGLKLELNVESETLIPMESLLPALGTAAEAHWPTLLELRSDGQKRFCVVTGVEVYSDSVELLVHDPELPLLEEGPARYRIYNSETGPTYLMDEVPVIDGVAALWAVSSLPEQEVAFIVDDGTPSFVLHGEGFRWGRTYDLGMGAPGRSSGQEGAGLTWASALEGTSSRAAGEWRILAPEAGRYAVYIYLSPHIRPSLLPARLEYFLANQSISETSALPEEKAGSGEEAEQALEEGVSIGVLEPGITASDEGWALVGRISLTEEPAYLRLPLTEAKGRRFVFDAVLLMKDASGEELP